MITYPQRVGGFFQEFSHVVYVSKPKKILITPPPPPSHKIPHEKPIAVVI